MNILQNKIVYAFGDSIVYGHIDPDNSFMRLIAERNFMQLHMFAVNGATVIEGSGNDIITQIEQAEASDTGPDFIVFDGYTNDAYAKTLDMLGVIHGKMDADFNAQTFCGAFEKIVCAMQKKWPNANIMFIIVHKSGGRDWDTQCTLRTLTLRICHAWGIEVVDIFNDTILDTRDGDQMEKYIIGGAGSHPNLAACEEFYVPAVTSKLKEIYSTDKKSSTFAG